jgi:signal transduction histidine kinase
MAYRFARASALDTAAARLATVAETFAQPTAQAPAWARQAREIASNPRVIEVARTGGRQVSDTARALVGRILADTLQSLAAELRTPSGEVLLSVGSRHMATILGRAAADSSDRTVTRPVDAADSTARPILPDSLRLTRSYPDTATVSELVRRAGEVLFERAMPVRDGGHVVGHLVEIRKATVSPTALRQLTRLVGEHAVLLVGNPDGSLWSDLHGEVAHPPPSDTPQYYTRDGRRWLSTSAPLPTAPWVIAVEFPEDALLAPVQALGRRLLAFGALVILIGVFVSERLSRNLTAPLTRLTAAAEGITGGDRITRGFELTRRDEIGRLSRAFAAMADSIRDSHDTLEHQIGERTSELRTALTRLRETQEELLRKERLATLGQLSGSIAHELRNPLGVMTNAVYYLDTVLKESPPKVRDHLGKLRAQLRLSESIIKGLLDFTRTSTAVPAEVNVAKLVDAQLARVGVPASIHIERDLPPDLPPLRADPVQIGQVLVNLFTNAVQAMEETGGVLSIRAHAASGRVWIEVGDSGPGIPLENLEKVFEPLFTTKARGIGLGLSVSRTLARTNDGELYVASHSGAGARFTLDLPAGDQSHGAMGAAPPAHAEAAGNDVATIA